MTTYPTFQAKPPPERKVGFNLSGVYGPHHDRAGEEWTETFDCLPALPAVSIGEGRAAYRIESATKQIVDAQRAARFISSAVVPEQKVTFNALVHDPHRLIDADLIGDVFNHLWGEYALRPTRPGEGSDNGQADTGATSAASSSGTGSTPTP